MPTAEETVVQIAHRLGVPEDDHVGMLLAVEQVIQQRNQLYDAVVGPKQPDDAPITVEVVNEIGVGVDVTASIVAGRVTNTGEWRGPIRVRVTVMNEEAAVNKVVFLYAEYSRMMPDLPRVHTLQDFTQMVLMLGYAQGRLFERGHFTRDELNEHLIHGVVPEPSGEAHDV